MLEYSREKIVDDIRKVTGSRTCRFSGSSRTFSFFFWMSLETIGRFWIEWCEVFKLNHSSCFTAGAEMSGDYKTIQTTDRGSWTRLVAERIMKSGTILGKFWRKELTKHINPLNTIYEEESKTQHWNSCLKKLEKWSYHQLKWGRLWKEEAGSSVWVVAEKHWKLSLGYVQFEMFSRHPGDGGH